VGTYTYDNADRLTGIHWVKGANTLAYVDYTLDDAGNRTQRVDGLGTHTYDYDDLYRLTGVTYPGPDDVDYTYDAVGNRLTLVDSNGTTDYTYDAADRLTSVDPPSASPVTYTWDDNGNLTARGSDSFVWDAEDRMTSATVSSVTTTFAYNGDGLRDSLTVNSNTTTFTWDVNTSIPQVLDDEDFRYVYGLGRSAQVGAGTHYYLTDGLGSTMALTDDTGAVVNTYDYDVFGAERASTGTQDNDFTFAGEEVDESTGLQYLRARYYDVETGRFASTDPLSPVTGPNVYIYGLNQPTLFADPSGLISCGFCNKVKKAATGCASDPGGCAKSVAKAVATAPAKCLQDRTCTQVAGGLSVGAGLLTGNPALVTLGTTILTLDSGRGCLENPNLLDCAGVTIGAGSTALRFAVLGGLAADSYGLSEGLVNITSRLRGLSASEAALLQMRIRATKLCLTYCADAADGLSVGLTIITLLRQLNLSSHDSASMLAAGTKE
jgi:RHS repeat-associated protein